MKFAIILPMKIFMIILILSTTLLYSDNIVNDPTFKAVFTNSNNSDKTVLMIYTAKSCPQCAYMKEKVFKDSSVESILKRNFVVIEKDVNTDNLPDGFNYFGIPTIFFVDKNGKQIGKYIGSTRAKAFVKVLNEIQGLQK